MTPFYLRLYLFWGRKSLTLRVAIIRLFEGINSSVFSFAIVWLLAIDHPFEYLDMGGGISGLFSLDCGLYSI